MRCSPCGPLWKAICWPCTSYAETEQLLRDPSVPVEKNSRDCVEFGRDFCIGTYASKLKTQRAQIRTRYAIPGTPNNDCLVSCCCWACVVLQHDEEVRARLERGDHGVKEGAGGGCRDGGVYGGGGMVAGNGNGGGGGGLMR
ncbi:predicted protein [Chaetomium globosum CBS 148.51]|uniref:Uncharacterized protein n=1 Tax=Chaetomium globosum (strain ATCC 6205 / CBS 148.51 / DSM 1962 / NBRC 6347 / NRRL 1970) TaxID=306901 RepID=Q2GMB1_CHAGB|nr:uncharacterized protein CHGG_10893 [Chaetomium globosum CBS 148.51]EAQ83075.1 predicted protein [Chaetomium globosum CBS 148.51]